MIAAPLKLGRVADGGAAGSQFRDQVIAAPLKPSSSSITYSTSSNQFRDQVIAAPLKPAARAYHPLTPQQFRDQVIAAPLKRCIIGSAIRAYLEFRDQVIAAPLKRYRRTPERPVPYNSAIK